MTPRLPGVAEFKAALIDSLSNEDDQGLWEVAWRLDCSPGQPQAVMDAKVALAREATLDLLKRGVVEIWVMDGWPPKSTAPVSEADFLAVQGDDALWVAPDQADTLFQIRLRGRGFDRHQAPADETVAETKPVRSLLTHVIEAQDFDGKAELLAQIPHVRVLGGPLTFLDLAVDHSAVAESTFQQGPIPGQTWVIGKKGKPLGTLLVWVDGGYISALEYGWVTDEPPAALPSTDHLESTQ